MPLQQSANGKVVVQVPARPSTYRAEDYVTIEHSPKQTKSAPTDGESIQAQTQRQQSTEALRKFQDFLNEIFEAQDLIDASGGSFLNSKSSFFFQSFENEAEDGLSLSLKVLDRLRDELRKLTSLQRLRDVAVDDVRRLQQICEPSIERGQTINLHHDDTTSSEGQVSWKSRILRANNSVCCAIVAIYTMIGNPHNEDLVSGDIMRWSANTLNHVLNACIVPVVEARPDTNDDLLFSQANEQVEWLKLLLQSSRRLLETMTTACIEVRGGDMCVSTVEFCAARMIFVQNATSEKNSAIGTQVYESFRKAAMASVSRIYARFPRERPAIMDEILSSLDKLPSKSRSARTFRIGDGISIQLISALFMQLVQTTTMDVPGKPSEKNRAAKRKRHLPGIEDEQESDSDDTSDGKNQDLTESTDHKTQLFRQVNQLYNPAAKSTNDIVSYLVGKASKTTKTGEAPYRGILDLLVEDLINVADNIDWPAADLLLSALVGQMLWLADNEKIASTKNMALECLGTIASAVYDLRAKASKILEDINKSDRSVHSKAAADLSRFGKLLQEGRILPSDYLSFTGPYFIVVSHLQNRVEKLTLHQQSAKCYFLASITKYVSLVVQKSDSVPENIDEIIEVVLDLLRDGASKNDNLDYSAPMDVVAGAYLLCVLSRFSKSTDSILAQLATSLSSDQAHVRSRSLKSISVILEKDASVLDRIPSITQFVFKLNADDSANVRDSALSIIARFIIHRSAYSKQSFEQLQKSIDDEKPSIRKHVITHFKDIYLQVTNQRNRDAIMSKMLQRLNDIEDSVVLLAEQTLEELLLKPVQLQLQSDETSAAAAVSVKDVCSRFMSCIPEKTITEQMRKETESYTALLKRFFTALLKKDKKNREINYKILSKMVQTLFEQIISTEAAQQSLLLLTTLAEADPQLIPVLQLAKLQNYLSNVKGEHDQFLFRSAVRIFALVLPGLSETHKTMIAATQSALMRSVLTLDKRADLDAVMQCLAGIDSVLRNTEKLYRLTSSVCAKLSKPDTPVGSLERLLSIIGAVGKRIDLDKDRELFAKVTPDFKSKTVTGHVVLTLLPLTKSLRPLNIRASALQSLGYVCQASPAHFNNPEVRLTFFSTLQQVSNTDETRLQSVVLDIFDELYAARSAAKATLEKGHSGEKQGLKQMGGDARSRDQDSAISAITMDVVDAVLRICLSDDSKHAVPAARTLASISAQGLIHPKQCLGAFVAIGTSRNKEISAIGHHAQHLLHEQHESHCEREYLAAVVRAFKFQDSVGNDSCGSIYPGLQAKLHECFEIITMSNNKYVKKFLSSLVSRTTFDAGGLVEAEHVRLTRFIMQNIAFFPYKKLDELLHVVLQLELAYSKSGGEVAQMIELAQQKFPDLIVHEEVDGDPAFGIAPCMVERRSTNPSLVLQLQRLSPGAACLTLLIETRTHLLRQYGIGRDVRVAMTNSKQAKDTNKAPVKIHGITGEKFWNRSNEIMSCLESDDATVQLCKDFVGAMSVDEDFEMGDDLDLSLGANGIGDVSGFEPMDMGRSGTPGGRKRKSSNTAHETPSKRPRGRHKKAQRRSSSVSSLDQDGDGDFAG